MPDWLNGAALALLRRLDAERAHQLGLRAIRLGLAGRAAPADDPMLGQTVLGRTFRNPFGLAAGFDKDAIAATGLARLGFGFLEFGTVTEAPQPGQPRPRLFRLEQDQGLINRMGFPSQGIAALLARLPSQLAVPFGINIGPNRDAQPETAYIRLLTRLVGEPAGPTAPGYVALNLSSPNTPGLRDVQSANRLRRLLDGLAMIGATRPPILLKLSPDLTTASLLEIIEAALAGGVAGLIIGNTTTLPVTVRSMLAAQQAGGVSGAPLFVRSTALLAKAWQLSRGRLALIGCGGITSPATAVAKIYAGASLVQLYTGFAYQGPGLVTRLRREVPALLRADGFASLSAAVGAKAGAY